jgi:hypothetical protein
MPTWTDASEAPPPTNCRVPEPRQPARELGSPGADHEAPPCIKLRSIFAIAVAVTVPKYRHRS